MKNNPFSTLCLVAIFMAGCNNLPKDESLTDGTFRSVGLNLTGTVNVEVVIENQRISQVNVKEDLNMFDKQSKQICNSIIEQQTPEVDAVSGATYLSNGIKEAVRDALAQSRGEMKGSEGEKLAFTPGTYSVEADGFNGKIKGDVTFSSDSLKSIVITQSCETPNIGQGAIEPMIQKMTAANGIGVDGMTGATFTAHAMRQLACNAAEKAKVSNRMKFFNNTLVKSSQTVEDSWDVVIVGGGGAGLFAAAQAAEYGNSVLVIEKNAEVGGNTIASGGLYQAVDPNLVWDINSPESTTATGYDGKRVDKVKATVGSIDMLKILLGWEETPFDQKFYETHEFVAGDVKEQARHGVHPEYLSVLQNLKKEIKSYLAYAEPKIAKGMKESDLLLFSTQNLHIFQTYYGGLRQSSDKKEWIYGDYDLVAQLVNESSKLKPWLMSMGVGFVNAQVTLPGAIWYRCNIMTGCSTDADGDGKNEFYPDKWGTYVMAPMTKMLKADRHNRVMKSTTALDLIFNDGKVTGVNAVMDDGTKVVAHASKGVVIASGGYAANLDKVLKTNKYWAEKYLSRSIGTTNRSSLMGDGLTMAAKVGAGECGEGWTQLLPVAYAVDGMIATGSIETAIFVSPATGKRFVDECAERDVLSLAAFRNGMNYKGARGTFFYISGNLGTDQAGLAEYKADIPGKEWCRKGSELAAFFEEQGFDTDAKQVLQTIREYDMAAIEHRQPKDFSKQHQVGLIGKANLNSDGTYDKNSYDLDNAPLRIRLLAPSRHHTMGGLHIDTQRRVLDKNGKPVPGLFAAGEVTGGIFGGNRLGGNALTEVIVSGRIAARNFK